MKKVNKDPASRVGRVSQVLRGKMGLWGSEETPGFQDQMELLDLAD